MTKINVRGMRLKDIDAVYEIEKASFSTPWSKDSFIREIRDNLLAKYFVVVYNDKLVGYGGMWLIIDEAHITNIAIHPDYRGKGLGSLLLEAMIDYARQSNIFKMTLEVRRSNTKAISLYKKHGFKECGIRPKYYTDNGEDAIIMWREEYYAG